MGSAVNTPAGAGTLLISAVSVWTSWYSIINNPSGTGSSWLQRSMPCRAGAATPRRFGFSSLFPLQNFKSVCASNCHDHAILSVAMHRQGVSRMTSAGTTNAAFLSRGPWQRGPGVQATDDGPHGAGDRAASASAPVRPSRRHPIPDRSRPGADGAADARSFERPLIHERGTGNARACVAAAARMLGA